MRVVVKAADRAAVSEPDNLRELAVQAMGLNEQDVAAALAASGLGSLADGHAWLKIDRLRAAGQPESPEWDEGFDGMIAFARSRGWLSGDGESVRAHIEYGS